APRLPPTLSLHHALPICVDTNTDPNHCGGCGTTCPADRFCFAGQCQCQGLLKDCDGVCVDTTRDLQNCGACGNVCLGGPNAEPRSEEHTSELQSREHLVC